MITIPLFNMSDVSDVAVLSNVVGDICTTEVIEELEVEKLPADLLDEPIIDTKGDAGQELAKYREEYQGLSSMSVRPCTSQKCIKNSENPIF